MSYALKISLKRSSTFFNNMPNQHDVLFLHLINLQLYIQKNQICIVRLNTKGALSYLNVKILIRASH